VPLPTPGEAGAPRSFAARVRGVCSGCRPRLAVVERAAEFVHALPDPRPELAVVTPAELAAPGEPLPLHPAARMMPAFIQYTSGSTGAPKGVVVTHGNLLANCRAIRDATGYTRDDRMVSWLPLHHDMGLVGGLLTSLYCAAETWLMPPITFLARPVTWLEALGRFHATLTVAPTFAYSLCARKIPPKQLAGIDLSSLRLAYIGAEPIDVATVDAFVERFAAYGLPPTALYPVYGLAEATLAVAFPAPGSPVRRDTVDRRRLVSAGVAVPAASGAAHAVSFVSVGRSLPQHRVTVVDVDTGDALGERRVGELVVEGASVTPRYFEDADAPARGALRTGDLGYRADGELYVVDRIKDLVIVAGQNYAPSDIEAAVGDVDGVRRGRVVAFAAPSAGTDALHVVAEIGADNHRPVAELRDAVGRHVREVIGLSPASVTLVAPGSLERTSSGKIQRRACAAAHAEGRLAVVDAPADLVSRA
jgi:acyl-CoA synthetase (AMP-forming)/AMP-acid ligase II